MRTGDRIGHYEILGPLGQGGMGEVLRARDLRLDRVVALKVLRDRFEHDQTRHARFHREAQMLAAFGHPCVATVHSFEEIEGRHILVMELVEGRDLAARLAEGPLPVPAALQVAQHVAEALEAAHARGIVHRDLKPSNIMLTPDGGVKILDFGLAKLDAPINGEIDDDEATVVSPPAAAPTEPGTILGTAAYMSPEQARSRPVDRRTDIWALGCVLYEMLAGRRAFPGRTASDALAAVLREEPDWSALPAGTPWAVAHALRRCLAKDRRRRLHDAADLRIELVAALSGDEDTTDPAAPGTPAGRIPSRRIPAILAVSALLAAACLAAAFVLGRGSAGGDGLEPSVPKVRHLTYTGRDWSPSASPDGEMIAFASDRDGRSRIWLKQVRGGTEAPLTGGPDDLPRFSPDGAQVLFVRDEAGGRNLYRVPVVGGQPRKLLDDVVEADWSPGGERIAFLRMIPEGGRNRVVAGIADLRAGVERLLAEVENRACYGIRWSPDGRWLTMNESSLTGNVAEASTLDLIDLESDALRRLTLTGWSGPYTAVAWLPDGGAFVVGQAVDALTHVLSTPAQVFTYDLATGRTRPLFWAPIRVPRGGWGFSALSLLGSDRVVLDTESTHARLLEVPWPVDGEPLQPRTLTSGLGRDRQPAYSPDGQRIVFSSNRSGNVDLWLVDRRTRDLRQLTDDPADDWDPAFSPDGRQLIWSSNRGGAMEIWLAEADGSRARQVSRDGVDAENPTMTADGRWIVYASSHDAKLGIWRIRPDGGEAERLFEGSMLLPEVSPDGRFALFVQYQRLEYVIKVIELATGRLVDFAIETNASQRHLNIVLGRARWTPDGRAIVYVGQDDRGRTGLYVQDFAPDRDTAGTRRPLLGFRPDLIPESLGISPDGRHLTISTMSELRSLELAEHLRLPGGG